MPTQHVGMLTSICFLLRHNDEMLKRHSAPAAILFTTRLTDGGLQLTEAEIDTERRRRGGGQKKSKFGSPVSGGVTAGFLQSPSHLFAKHAPRPTDRSIANKVGRSWRGNSFVIVHHHESPLQYTSG